MASNGTADNNPLVAREKLSARQLPMMTLSDGSESSMTPPPKPRTETEPPKRATQRFAVSGNAIVTGGAGGLGLVAARALLEHGASGVALFDANPAHSQSAIDALRSEFAKKGGPDGTGARVSAHAVDVRDETALAVAVKEAQAALGDAPLRHLLCFAGVVDTDDALDLDPARFRRMLDINTTGVFLTCQAVARVMVEQQAGGSMVLIGSMGSHRCLFPQPQVHYNASKAAVVNMAMGFAAEWARYGIRVNSISPGYMDTILNEGEGLEVGRRIWKARIPLGRLGAAEELVGPVVMMCSEAGSYVTGTDLKVDGGAMVF